MAKGKLLIFRSKAEQAKEKEPIDLTTPYEGLSDLFTLEEIDEIRRDLESEDKDENVQDGPKD